MNQWPPAVKPLKCLKTSSTDNHTSDMLPTNTTNQPVGCINPPQAITLTIMSIFLICSNTLFITGLYKTRDRRTGFTRINKLFTILSVVDCCNGLINCPMFASYFCLQTHLAFAVTNAGSVLWHVSTNLTTYIACVRYLKIAEGEISSLRKNFLFSATVFAAVGGATWAVVQAVLVALNNTDWLYAIAMRGIFDAAIVALAVVLIVLLVLFIRRHRRRSTVSSHRDASHSSYEVRLTWTIVTVSSSAAFLCLPVFLLAPVLAASRALQTSPQVMDGLWDALNWGIVVMYSNSGWNALIYMIRCKKLR